MSDCAEDIIIDIDEVEQCVKSLKCNKAAGLDNTVGEHLLHSHPAIIMLLKQLFTVMLTHAYVPSAFGAGIVVPIVKDKRVKPKYSRQL